MAKQLAWFLTPAGRKLSFGFMTTASISAFGLLYCPHTFFLVKFKEIVSMYQAAMPVPLSDRLAKRWQDTLADLSLPEYEVKNMKPFTVFGFDLFNAGTTTSQYGAIIGLPINFTYESVSTVNPSPILVNHETVDWEREDAKKLLDALVLSEDAQRYGIAREILMTRHNKPLIRATLGAFMVSSTYVLCRGINDKFKLLERPLPVRGFIYFVGCLFSFGVWAIQNDMYNNHWEKEADQHLAQLNERYTMGAIEFYDKLLKKNMALRSLNGTTGEEIYTPTGNEKFLFRQPRLPIEQRKTFFENNLARIKHEKELLEEDQADSRIA